MSDNVVPFNGITYGDMDPKVVLQAAIDRNLDNVVVLGYLENGDMYFAGSTSDGPLVLWLLENFKAELMQTEPSK